MCKQQAESFQETHKIRSILQYVYIHTYFDNNIYKYG